jgi:hypothetical protein
VALPPVDLPPPTDAPINPGLAPSPPAASLCGFSLPKSLFKFGFKLPALAFPPAIPTPYLALGLNCSLSNPLDVSAGLRYGGGRTPNADPDPDLLEQAQ